MNRAQRRSLGKVKRQKEKGRTVVVGKCNTCCHYGEADVGNGCFECHHWHDGVPDPKTHVCPGGYCESEWRGE